ncbi:uncharacterized protein LOC117008855 isoform X2 [Catharus ustulatus]|uniref:uncharacterized protein LOC117008855 isoform X2 n=1 Tax=Catharus ustulatus TaxID=91951 RepID=UPI001409BA90|nr:uncharacterized protein LOC117008855 isoform X2 [Catharus ustulatus]
MEETFMRGRASLTTAILQKSCPDRSPLRQKKRHLLDGGLQAAEPGIIWWAKPPSSLADGEVMPEALGSVVRISAGKTAHLVGRR